MLTMDEGPSGLTPSLGPEGLFLEGLGRLEGSSMRI